MSFKPRLSSFLLGLMILLSVGVVWAASKFAYTGEHLTRRSQDHVLSVLTAYDKTCDKGCLYYGSDVSKFVRIKQKSTPTSWYTWTQIDNVLQTVKYFNKVDLERRANGDFVMVTRLLDDSDKATIKELTRLTKYEHSPAFDAGITRFTVTAQPDGRVKVVQAMSMTASGMLAAFGGKIENGMREGAATTFQNIEK
jgi:hypothetical protein